MPTPQQRIEPNEDKMKELILFVAEQSMGDDEFGSIKLNKILFYADFTAYLNFGKPITGMEYMRLENGPAPRRFIPISKELEEEGAFAIIPRQHYNREQKRPFALRPADLSIFSPQEITLVSKIIKALWGRNAREVSDLSHKFIGWQLAEEKETIPYSVARIEKREPTVREFEFGKKLVASLPPF